MAIENEPEPSTSAQHTSAGQTVLEPRCWIFLSVEHLVFPVALAKATLKKPAYPREIQRAVGK